MAGVELSLAASERLDRMIVTHSLPANTRLRVGRSLLTLARFPSMGRRLEGEWSGFRFILGPWRWLLIVYVYDDTAERVLVVNFQDARSSSAVTNLARAR
ncbi:MAG TPA: type II toxin-antitoxin system RelE/ParE family toxin [Solirubrobacteraceae bacterium]|nr:type II toxin-antitoxin system RelE/ParE family toxin [Solirubrobacteraceae bacterium]